MRKFLLYFTLLAGMAVASCSTVLNNLPGVYRVDVQQGNIVDQSMVDQLRPGMSKRQVLYIMGSPMLKESFRENRWEYLYSNQPGGEPRQQKRLILIFEGDSVVGLQGDFKPSKLPVLKPSPDATVEVPKRNLDESLWGTIKGWFGTDKSAAASQQESEKENAPAEESKSLWESLTGWMRSDEGDEPQKGEGQGVTPADAEGE
ncbi:MULTISPECIES: outer membrane protein assembly factor BamE [Methylomicrobium]|uniref:Outer membrane protein assembly factor BamE n=1 Tax=Methylomicrobium album BG8 TaxID=686340 RepID=H8GJB9_METAL|nr:MULTISPECIES: outer membrane protein assembly factor BamE [Methylomicrobium]EIC29109.1 small protein A (tmRNA-binding) [Methylomicrobium album BG8]